MQLSLVNNLAVLATTGTIATAYGYDLAWCGKDESLEKVSTFAKQDLL